MTLHTTVRNIITTLFFSLLFSVLIFLYSPLFSSAQLIPELESVILLDITPTYPGPNERVSVSAESFSVDLNNSTISWFVNGVLVQQSIGGKIFQLATGMLGSSTSIDIVVETSGSLVETESVTIRPTDADILWQGNTFSHPLYKGKHIPSVGSGIQIEVIPHFINEAGFRLNASELVYTWRIEDKALPNASGRGKNSIIVTQTKPIDSILVEVEIESSDKLLFRKERISIPVQDSELLIYENNPLLGILFNKTIKDLYSLLGQETKFIVYPFFMSITNRNALYVDYSWSLNDEPITLGEDKSSITVSHTGTGEGTANITVAAQNSRDIFQSAEDEFIVEFGKNSSSGFGF